MNNMFELSPINFYGILSSQGHVGQKYIKMTMGTNPDTIGSEYHLLLAKREFENSLYLDLPLMNVSIIEE